MSGTQTETLVQLPIHDDGVETSEADGEKPIKVDFDLQIGVEEILVDVDPSVSLEFLQRANALAGKRPPHVPTKEWLVNTHNEHVQKFQAAMVGQTNVPRMVKKVILALSYAPSTTPIKDLETMPLNELLVENHHEEKKLVVRTVTPPYQGAGVVTIVEDEFGNVEKLGIYNQGDSSILNAVPEGSVVLIKEPYYKFSGNHDFMICVDHPSDAILLRQGPDDELIPEVFRTGEELKEAPQWREAGDKAYMARNYPLAMANYTRALELAPADDEKFRSDLCLKRAGVQLTLKCYDGAMADALASLGGPTDWKSYFIAARAAYELTFFDVSKQHFEASIAIKPPTPQIEKEYKRCLARVDEAENGNYDFATIAQSVTSKNIHLDKASYITKTEVRDSPHHGRGLFATRDIKAGEIIYAEKSTCVPNEFHPEHNAAAAYAQLVERCNDNPSVHEKVLGLYGGTYKRSGRESEVIDGKHVVDVYLLESIRRKNCFSGTHVSAQAANANWDMWKQGMSRGLWVYSAYSNHSCQPNSNRSFVGDMLISIAVVDIPADTEITQIYLPPKAAYLQRLEQYRKSWGFKCACDMCAGEGKSPKEMHEKRIVALRELEANLRKKNMSARLYQSDAMIREIERLHKRLDSLFEPEIYGTLPRMMMIWPSMWFMEVYRTRKAWKKAIKWALEVLRNFGFIDPLRNMDGEVGGDESMLWVFKSQTGVVTFETIKALKVLAEGYWALGETVLQRQATAAAKIALKCMVGFVTEETYWSFN
ncbi:hypothetical protein D7B24_001992 [Verticillium nonalfalfae]|uniref:SET domain-containing protein n=1 Tax=Verticillium nonalfalfae TaxID=1051616 RepID=A0A3M9XYJ2_9PEZI|nr:uncharacterized protein D7B24_001992 [Verticillium nonalfalfae]RNJ53339.1 hypothetical protein D7B24_001992 [Verticillium nonalfalfae]